MSCYMKSSKDTTITIPNNVDINGITYYNILVTIGNVHWTVRHRYSEFVDLHLKLINEQSIGRDLLPPKKVIYFQMNNLFNFHEFHFNIYYYYLGDWKSFASISCTTSKRSRNLFKKCINIFTISNVS